jgi:DNA-binding response OmpR family regulator
VPRRVLFVEDEPELRDAYRRYFGRRFEIQLAATGTEAFRLLDGAAPDLVILDMRLPDTDGIEVLQYVRERHPDVPVLITTAYASTRPVLDVLGIEHSGFLLKPYTLSELEERIDAIE